MWNLLSILLILAMLRATNSLTALVTGSTDGIGKHTSRRLLQSGYKVLIHGRSQSRVDATISELQRYGEVESFTHDISTVSGCLALTSAVKSSHESLNLLINNAGVFCDTYSLSSSGLETTFAVNVLAPFTITRELLPLLQKTKNSRIINVSSISQNDGPRTISPSTVLNSVFQNRETWNKYATYGISKRLIAMYSLNLSKKFDSPTVMSCDPGTVNTKMLLAGWGPCGIDIEDANNEYDLATKELGEDDHGQYFFGRRVHPDVESVENQEELINLLEELSTKY